MSNAPPLHASGMPDRRRAPRIAPLSPDIYPTSASPVPRVALDELKSRPVKPGQASFFFFDHHFQYNAVKVLPGEYYVSHEDLVIMTVGDVVGQVGTTNTMKIIKVGSRK